MKQNEGRAEREGKKKKEEETKFTNKSVVPQAPLLV